MLPTPNDFVSGVTVKQKETIPPANFTGVGADLRTLILQYAAMNTYATVVEEVNWNPLAAKLGVRYDDLKEMIDQITQDGNFWLEVLQRRIKRGNAARIFSDAAWEDAESLAVRRLVQMLERNLIKDTGELLAIASAARKLSGAGANTPSHNVNVNFNLGGDPMNGDLPEAGSRMTIELTPRIAKAMSQPPVDKTTRTIDGEMINAKELREFAHVFTEEKNNEQE